ncbi:CO/xanthine dehydrogenase FAD-binding subunit [Rhodococcus sp. SMB37]|nr:CO/xanthine dehydrogenase FAD-binding subunit [Rhodococcus sp. SMB37]
MSAVDLHTITAYDLAHERGDLAIGPGEAFVAGGTWMFSEPQLHLHRLVDLTGLDWPAVTLTADHLEIAATCTVERLSVLSTTERWRAAPLFRQCAQALLASWKIWKRATVGGNICLSFPAGAMISLAAALDATAVVWTSDGRENFYPITEFVTGSATNVLAPGDVLRSIRVPLSALEAPTAFRKIALSPLGRSGAIVIGRRDTNGGVALSVTASTVRPYVLKFHELPSEPDMSEALARFVPADAYHSDSHGTADWRQAVTAVLAEEVRIELSNREYPA